MRLLQLIAISAASLASQQALSAEPARVVPAPAVDMPATTETSQIAVLAGGCFWGLEGVFEHVRGVTAVRSGYAGGDPGKANYKAVTSGATGHAESVEITFDPRTVSYGKLLQVYFSVATDPTQLNRQGPDIGAQYRGEIFFTNADQERVARAYIEQLGEARVFSRPVATKVSALARFHPAEGYHQDYLSKHPSQPYIVAHDLPKIENLKKLFPDLYTPDRVN